MSVHQPDAQAGQPNAEGPPAFRVVRRGYDPKEVDASFAQLGARLKEAVDQYATAERARAQLQDEVTSLQQRAPSFEQVGGEAAALLVEAGRTAEQMVENARRRADTIIEKAQQQAEQLRTDVTAEAQRVLEQAREVAEQIRAEAEAERTAVVHETDQVREFRDGLLDDLGRVHGEISVLLERTRKQRDEGRAAAGNAEPTATAAPDAKAEKPAEPAKVGEAK
jgi:cell division septum initiation protein DivIVA